MKPVERAEARRLRSQDGMSIKHIATTVGVSPSTVSRWVADVELTPAQLGVLRTANPALNRQLSGARENSRRRRIEREDAQLSGRRTAFRDDALHRMGCMLYWAEGSKARCRVVFSNSDVDMMRLFVRFLRECHGVPDERITFSCNCYLGNGVSLEEIEHYWLTQLRLPASSLRPSIVNRPSRASRLRRRTLIYGTGRVCVYSSALVQHIYGAIQEYAGISRPEWLDG